MHNFRPCALAVNVELTARHRNDKDEKKKKKKPDHGFFRNHQIMTIAAKKPPSFGWAFCGNDSHIGCACHTSDNYSGNKTKTHSLVWKEAGGSARVYRSRGF